MKIANLLGATIWLALLTVSTMSEEYTFLYQPAPILIGSIQEGKTKSNNVSSLIFCCFFFEINYPSPSSHKACDHSIGECTDFTMCEVSTVRVDEEGRAISGTGNLTCPGRYEVCCVPSQLKINQFQMFVIEQEAAAAAAAKAAEAAEAASNTSEQSPQYDL